MAGGGAGESYTLVDEEDMAVRNISVISVSQGRYRVDINRAGAGNWVMLEGVDESIVKTATITAAQGTLRPNRRQSRWQPHSRDERGARWHDGLVHLLSPTHPLTHTLLLPCWCGWFSGR